MDSDKENSRVGKNISSLASIALVYSDSESENEANDAGDSDKIICQEKPLGNNELSEMVGPTTNIDSSQTNGETDKSIEKTETNGIQIIQVQQTSFNSPTIDVTSQGNQLQISSDNNEIEVLKIIAHDDKQSPFDNNQESAEKRNKKMKVSEIKIIEVELNSSKAPKIHVTGSVDESKPKNNDKVKETKEHNQQMEIDEIQIIKEQLNNSNLIKINDSRQINNSGAVGAQNREDNSEKKDDDQIMIISESKNYRNTEDNNNYSSDSSSDSSDSDSSTASSDSSDSDSEAESDRVVKKQVPSKNSNNKQSKFKGEFDDLPPIGNLQISVPEVLCEPLGQVAWMVEQMVVVKPKADIPTLNLDTMLFIERGKRALGQIFDVFGQVTDPHYCVRFNSSEHIVESDIKVGMNVYFCPNTEYTSVVFLSELTKLKGVDPIDDDEAPQFSDDEAEQAYYANLKKNTKVKRTPDEVSNKRRRNNSNGWHHQNSWNNYQRYENRPRPNNAYFYRNSRNYQMNPWQAPPPQFWDYPTYIQPPRYNEACINAIQAATFQNQYSQQYPQDPTNQQSENSQNNPVNPTFTPQTSFQQVSMLPPINFTTPPPPPPPLS